MAGLAEDDLKPRRTPAWLVPVAVGLLVMLLLGAAAWWLKGLAGQTTAPQRQVARIAVLPDTPPPPPPPPPRDQPPPPQREQKPAPQEAPKPREAEVEAAALKMEGAAGSGPSAFAAGSVTQDYRGGTPASAPTRAAPTGADRAQERLFAQSVRQQLQAEIERRLRNEQVQLTGTFQLWLARDGAIERLELLPGPDAKDDADLRAALDETTRNVRLPPPPAGMQQPLRFRLTVRPLG
jgi:outer membrane biosynthesis protein TonB